MAIIVRDVSDDEIQRSLDIENAAYAGNPLGPILFPGPFPEESKSKRAPEMIELRKNDPTCHFIQAYDEESKQMVAFAKWHVYDTPEAAQAAQRPSRTFGAGTNPEACEAFFGILSARKKEHMGNRLHLCKLACIHPSSLSACANADTNRSSYASHRPCISRARSGRDVG